MIDPKTGQWADNTTCPRCHRRHPPMWSCTYAQAVAIAAKPIVTEPVLLDLEPRVTDNLADEIRRRFKLVCRRCGSEDITIDVERGYGGSEYTGADPNTFSMGCNTCKQNDLIESI